MVQYIVWIYYTFTKVNEIMTCSSMSHEQDAMFAENSFLANYSTSLLINIVLKKKIKKISMSNITILDVTFNIKIPKI